MAGLVTTLGKGEAIRIGEALVRVEAIKRGHATLRIIAPRHVAIAEVGEPPYRLAVPLPDSCDASDEDEPALTPLPQAA